jgi:DNA-binding Lrp family transcriptional regulator
MLDIDNIDKRILFELDKNSRIPDVQLAKRVGKSKEAVRYRIKKLVSSGIIKKFTIWIDPTKLNYQVFKIYLMLSNLPERRKELIDHVSSDKRLFWLGIADGAWNAGLTFFVRNAKEFFELKNNLFSRFGDLIIESKTANVVSINIHEKTFLHSSDPKWLTFFDESKEIQIDKTSIAILRMLFENSRENLATIAYKEKVSVDIIRSRMKRLEKDKIIVKYTIAIDFEKLGYEFYKSFIYFKDLNDSSMKKFISYVLMDKNIIHIIKQISPWDIELEILCKNYKEYNQIISSLTEKFPGLISKIETAIMSEDQVFPAKQMVFE